MVGILQPSDIEIVLRLGSVSVLKRKALFYVYLKLTVLVKQSIRSSCLDIFKIGDRDVFVITRRKSIVTQNGFSQKYGDYLLSGTPIFSTAVGEVTRILENRKNIFFTNESNSKEFAKTINYVLEHPDIAGKVGMNGRQYAIENFDYRFIANRIKNILNLESKS